MVCNSPNKVNTKIRALISKSHRQFAQAASYGYSANLMPKLLMHKKHGDIPIILSICPIYCSSSPSTNWACRLAGVTTDFTTGRIIFRVCWWQKSSSMLWWLRTQFTTLLSVLGGPYSCLTSPLRVKSRMGVRKVQVSYKLTYIQI